MTHSFVHLRKRITAVTVLFGLGISQPGLTETTDCTPITTLPSVITVQGILNRPGF